MNDVCQKPLIVGESNPYGGDEYYALYPAPDGCSGHRLCCLILGMSRAAYLEAFDRCNLVVGKWSAPAARAAAESILITRPRPQRLILLGSKVTTAFGLKFDPQITYDILPHRARALVLPHPSGLCRLWQEAGAIGRARAAVREFLPDLPDLCAAIGRADSQETRR